MKNHKVNKLWVNKSYNDSKNSFINSTIILNK